MTRKFKLLKDTPRTKAGTIFEKANKTTDEDFYDDHYYSDLASSSREMFFYRDVILPDWFEEITEPETEPKFVLMSPALTKHNKNIRVSDLLFENAKEAESFWCNCFYAWPATQVIDGKDVPIQIKVPVKK